MESSTNTVVTYLGLGGNLESPKAQIKHAIQAIANLSGCTLLRSSSLYQSKPLIYPNMTEREKAQLYINAVVAVETHLSPLDLLNALQGIENQAGRNRAEQAHQWAARPLDIDILLYGDISLNTPRLVVPHPRMKDRNFVLYPLYEIAPDLSVANLDSMANLLNNCAPEGIERLEATD